MSEPAVDEQLLQSRGAAEAAIEKTDGDCDATMTYAEEPSQVPPHLTKETSRGRTHTPALPSERPESGSRAASALPEASYELPSQSKMSGAPVRQYINTKLTQHLLDGMKMIALQQPQDPLRVLGQFLLDRSKEVEGTK